MIQSQSTPSSPSANNNITPVKVAFLLTPLLCIQCTIGLQNNDANGDSQWLCISSCDSGFNLQIKHLVVFCVSSVIPNISLFSHPWSMIYRGDSYKAVGYHRRPTHSTEDGTLGIKFPGNTYTEACVSTNGDGKGH